MEYEVYVYTVYEMYTIYEVQDKLRLIFRSDTHVQLSMLAQCRENLADAAQVLIEVSCQYGQGTRVMEEVRGQWSQVGSTD